MVSLAQPKMGLIRNLLGRTRYPDNEWTRDRDGTPLRPYDTATYTMAELMGVRVDAVDEVAGGDLQRVAAALDIAGTVRSGGDLVALDGRLNASFRAVNQLLDSGATVWRVDGGEVAGSALSREDFVVGSVPGERLREVAATTGVDMRSLARPRAIRRST